MSRAGLLLLAAAIAVGCTGTPSWEEPAPARTTTKPAEAPKATEHATTRPAPTPTRTPTPTPTPTGGGGPAEIPGVEIKPTDPHDEDGPTTTPPTPPNPDDPPPPEETPTDTPAPVPAEPPATAPPPDPTASWP